MRPNDCQPGCFSVHVGILPLQNCGSASLLCCYEERPEAHDTSASDSCLVVWLGPTDGLERAYPALRWLYQTKLVRAQYWGVFIASFPAALLCFGLRGILSDPTALAVTSPIGLASAIVAWSWLGKKIVFARKRINDEASCCS